MGYDHHHHGHGCCDHGHRRHGHHHHHGCCGHGHHEEEHGGCDFEEKRVIDTIVDLVGERVGQLLDARQGHHEPRDGGGDEKRIVDLVVGLVAEKVREIVVAELDRRFGRPGGETTPPAAEPR